MHIKLKRAPGIFIVGFMGSGKSTAGRLVADRIGWQFADLDEQIEAKEQDTIAHIFQARGEAEFRQVETEMIGAYVRHVVRGAPTVIALGGGAFVQPANFDLIKSHGISIWLDCSFESVQRRISADTRDRPLARDPEKLRRLFDDRSAAYSQADFRIDGNCETEKTVEAILALPLWK